MKHDEREITAVQDHLKCDRTTAISFLDEARTLESKYSKGGKGKMAETVILKKYRMLSGTHVLPDGSVAQAGDIVELDPKVAEPPGAFSDKFEPYIDPREQVERQFVHAGDQDSTSPIIAAPAAPVHNDFIEPVAPNAPVGSEQNATVVPPSVGANAGNAETSGVDAVRKERLPSDSDAHPQVNNAGLADASKITEKLAGHTTDSASTSSPEPKNPGPKQK